VAAGPEALGGAASISLTTCNLNGFKDRDDAPAAALGRDLHQCVFLQETKLNNIDHLRTVRRHITNHVGHQQYRLFVSDERSAVHSSSARRRKGVATFFHISMPGFNSLKPVWHQRVEGRYLAVMTTWGATQVYFHNLYAPVEDALRADFFAALPRDFEPDSIHFVGGDLNLPLDVALDATTYVAGSNLGKAECQAWLAALGVLDAWRTMYPTDKVFSGPGGKNRLDYLFVDHELVANHLQSSKYGPNQYRGDHLCHTTVLAATPTPTATRPKHPAVWRLPRELLLDPRNCTAIVGEAERLLAELQADPECNVGGRWCGWLRRMKSRLRQGQFNRQRHRKVLLEQLQRTSTKAKADARCGRGSEEAADRASAQYEAAKAELDQFSRDSGFDRHAGANEVATAHFLRKPPALKVPITQAKAGAATTTDPDEVAAIFTAHWRRIMVTPSDAPPPDLALRAAVVDHVTAALTADESAELDRPFSVEELSTAIKTMPKGKSPGPDGWPAAFFQLAPDVFAAILVMVFDYQNTKHGCMLAHQRRSSVTLLYKKGDRTDPGNYRPIALMAVEVKILSRAMTYRLAAVAPKIIHESQAGFVKGRSITDLVLLVKALQLKATRESKEWYATFLDYAKAYDMVQWSFMYDVLAKMNVGPSFIRWVKLLYRKPNVHLLLNGALGPAIRPTRGVKQGCPLSCLLFDIYLEPLGAMLRACPGAGITLDNGDVLTGGFFADDSTVFSGSLESAEYQTTEIVGTFCAASGAVLNKAKCVTLALNAHDTPETRALEGRRGYPSLTIAAPGTPVRYLGVYIGQGLAPEYQAQLLNDKILAAFAHWGVRGRTVAGRVVLATSVILSTVWYVTAVTPVSDTYLKVWQRMVNNFVTGAKTEVTDKYQPPIHKMWMYDKQLGLGVPHVASCIRGQRLRLLQKYMVAIQLPSPPAWSVLVHEQFSHCMGTLSRRSHPFDFMSYSPMISSAWLELGALQPLWLDVWRSWSAVPMRHKMPLLPDLATTLSMPIWLTTYHEFVAPSVKTAASLLSRCPETRRWCQHGVGNGLHCLRDLLCNTPGQLPGFWPTFSQFHGALTSGYRGVVVALRQGNVHVPVMHYASTVYKHLTDVYTAVRRRLHVRPAVSLADVAAAPHQFRMLINNYSQPFESWPRRAVSKMAKHSPLPTAIHPTYTAARPSHALARTYMGQFKASLSWLTPVHADVWFRATMKMLPVNSRYSYCRETEPDKMLCPHGCGHDETAMHALRSCRAVVSLWSMHQAAWATTGVQFSWFAITNVDNFAVTGVGAPLKNAMYQLWTMVTGVTLHLAWQTRNNAKHRNRAPPPVHALLDISFVIWMTTVRRWMRLQADDDPGLAATKSALAILLRQVHYRDMHAKYPRCLELDTVYDVA
jgi:hypothetical protein